MCFRPEGGSGYTDQQVYERAGSSPGRAAIRSARSGPRSTAGLAGRENVVASADCGFSSQATYAPEIHPTIVWAKFESLAEGARRATARLWP
ncbi:MAG: hypothetical protein ACRDOH_25360 [Streptosporangiaceae bacterium]